MSTETGGGASVIRVRKVDTQARKEVRRARAIKSTGYLESVSGATNFSREFYRRGTVRL